MAEALRWGILGTGGIASSFTEDLSLSALGEVVAVGSRTSAGADAFCQRFGVERGYGSYEALVDDPGVDAVYVATPHPFHHAGAVLAIEAGKPVLVEKPFTVSRQEAEDLVRRARARGVFLMEAMWTRCLPHFGELRKIIDSGRIGKVRMLLAEHGFRFPYDLESRIYAPELGGGGLLDLGVYLLWLASFVFGAPERFAVSSAPAATGVDAQMALAFSYAEGQQAMLSTSIETLLPNRAVICGSEGRIELEATWYRPTRIAVIPTLAMASSGEAELFDGRAPGNGLRFEAEEVARCLAAGWTESPLVPLDETLSVMGQMDEIRARIGLRYPFEAS